jgi:predicted HTH domain antitoxin
VSLSWLQKAENQLHESSGLDYIDPRMANVTVEIPEEVFELAGMPEGTTSGRTTKLLALELYREGRVSLGRAAELAGVGIEEFMEFSAHRQVPLHYTADDLAEDRATAGRLKL